MHFQEKYCNVSYGAGGKVHLSPGKVPLILNRGQENLQYIHLICLMSKTLILQQLTPVGTDELAKRYFGLPAFFR